MWVSGGCPAASSASSRTGATASARVRRDAVDKQRRESRHRPPPSTTATARTSIARRKHKRSSRTTRATRTAWTVTTTAWRVRTCLVEVPSACLRLRAYHPRRRRAAVCHPHPAETTTARSSLTRKPARFYAPTQATRTSWTEMMTGRLVSPSVLEVSAVPRVQVRGTNV